MLKIKDLTIQEILNIHNDENFEGCDICPFANTPICKMIHSENKKYLLKEVKDLKKSDVEFSTVVVDSYDNIKE